MREMKFRAWDKDLKEMLFIDNIFNMTEKFSERGKLGYFILQQFTGLEDKNGKEIYEGDIMSSEMGNGRITWIECSGKFVLEGDNFLINPWDGYEVIGNIFENPELIK